MLASRPDLRQDGIARTCSAVVLLQWRTYWTGPADTTRATVSPNLTTTPPPPPPNLAVSLSVPFVWVGSPRRPTPDLGTTAARDGASASSRSPAQPMFISKREGVSGHTRQRKTQCNPTGTRAARRADHHRRSAARLALPCLARPSYNKISLRLIFNGRLGVRRWSRGCYHSLGQQFVL